MLLVFCFIQYFEPYRLILLIAFAVAAVAIIVAAAIVLSKDTKQIQKRMDSIFLDIMADPKAAAAFKPMIDRIMQAFGGGADEDKSEAASEAISDEMGMAMMKYMPLRGTLSFGGSKEAAQQVEALLKSLNN